MEESFAASCFLEAISAVAGGDLLVRFRGLPLPQPAMFFVAWERMYTIGGSGNQRDHWLDKTVCK